MKRFDPMASLAEMKHEFGEHGGVNMCIETSTTFTVMEAETMPEIFLGRSGPDAGGATSMGGTSTPPSTSWARRLRRWKGPRPATAPRVA